MISRVASLFFILCLSLSLISCNTVKPTPEKIDKLKLAEINIQLGMNYIERKDFQRAQTKLMIALDLAPDLPEAWYSTAYYFEKTGNIEEANVYYLKSITLAPKRGDVQNNYGTFLCRHRDYKNAIKHFELATRDKGYLDIASSYENAGLCSLKIPDKQLAAYYFKQALAQDPGRTTAKQELEKLKRDFNHGNN